MRFALAITPVVVAMLIGNALLIVAAVLGATALVMTRPARWARMRASFQAPAGKRCRTGALPPDDDPDFLRWFAERNQRQHGEDI